MPPKMNMMKLNLMINELKQIKKDLLPNEKDDSNEEEMKNMDAFQKKKFELNVLLRDLSKDVKRLEELRAAAPDGRDQATIKVYSENSKKLTQAGETWKQMKELLIKDEQKKKLDEKTLNDRKKMMTILAKEIQELGNKNSHIKQPKESETAKQLRARAEERATKRRERGKRERKKRQKEEEAAEEGDDKDKKKKKKKKDEDEGPDVDIQDEDLRPVQPLSEAEAKFFQQVEEAKQDQDKMLDDIMKGMSDLKSIAQDMNTSIKMQSAMADEIGKQMDSTIQKFETTNQRLKDILEESGGLSRWCPMLICIIILIALVGYMFNMLK